MALNLILPPLLLVAAIVTKSTTLLLLRRPALRRLPSRRLLQALAVLGLLLLLVALPRYFVAALLRRDLRTSASAVCKLHVLLTYFLCHAYAAIMALVALERQLFVCSAGGRPAVRRFGLPVALGLALLVDAHIPFTWRLSRRHHRRHCHLAMTGAVATLLRSLDAAALTYVPFTLIVVADSAILVALERARRRRQRWRQRTDLRREVRTTRTLLLVTATFLLCNLPHAVCDKMSACRRRRPVWYATTYLVYAQHLLEFPVYVISHPLIRRELQTMCRAARRQGA